MWYDFPVQATLNLVAGYMSWDKKKAPEVNLDTLTLLRRDRLDIYK